MQHHKDYMKLALSLARKAVGLSSPNPPVGAVVVKGGQVVGEGFTQPPGQSHAEVVALAHAEEEARGATLYITLEPCCYQGRTPPCTRAIIEAGIAVVHMALEDPNPKVQGRGRQQLEAAGVKVFVEDAGEEAEELIEPHRKWITTGLPHVTAKFAMSLDGKIATRTGESRWITGPQAREEAHRLRAASDAVMVGVGTVLQDDPQLTARANPGNADARQPLRVVVDSRGRTPPNARLLREPGGVLIAVAGESTAGARRLRKVGAEVISLPGEDGKVDLRALLSYLGQREIASLLVEGGGTLLGALFDLRLVDKVVAFVAPVVIGGSGAVSPVEGLGVASMAEALRLERPRFEPLGQDIKIVGYVSQPRGES